MDYLKQYPRSYSLSGKRRRIFGIRTEETEGLRLSDALSSPEAQLLRGKEARVREPGLGGKLGAEIVIYIGPVPTAEKHLAASKGSDATYAVPRDRLIGLRTPFSGCKHIPTNIQGIDLRAADGTVWLVLYSGIVTRHSHEDKTEAQVLAFCKVRKS